MGGKMAVSGRGMRLKNEVLWWYESSSPLNLSSHLSHTNRDGEYQATR